MKARAAGFWDYMTRVGYWWLILVWMLGWVVPRYLNIFYWNDFNKMFTPKAPRFWPPYVSYWYNSGFLELTPLNHFIWWNRFWVNSDTFLLSGVTLAGVIALVLLAAHMRVLKERQFEPEDKISYP